MEPARDMMNDVILDQDAGAALVECDPERSPGNVMDQVKEDNKIKLYRLDQYCVVRDPEGEMKEFVIEESMDDPTLDEGVRDLIQAHSPAPGKPHNLYTWGVRQKDKTWKIHQEISGKRMEEGDFKVCPFCGDSLRCGQCDKPIQSGWKVCPHCTTPLGAASG